jgi:glycerol uptake facilitator-like aquaporin
MLVFAVGLIGTALAPYNDPNSLRAPLVGSLTVWIAITLFIFAAAPASGGHLNPFITLSTFTAGLSTFSRSVLYIIGQCIGALIGAFFLKLGLGGADYYPSVCIAQILAIQVPNKSLILFLSPLYVIARLTLNLRIVRQGIVTGCTINTSFVPIGQALVLETGTSLVVVFLAFGVGLDPRQGQVFGPALSPILVGLTVAFASFATGFVRKGWYGACKPLSPAFPLLITR